MSGKAELLADVAASALNIPDKIYGRQGFVNILKQTVDRSLSGAVEAALVSGPPGIGKTALVGQIEGYVKSKNGFFISGKFGQLVDDAPYSGVVQAFHEFVRQILSQGEEQKAHWKERLLDGLQENGQVVVEVLPEIELLIGKQTPAAALGPKESQSRLVRAFQKLVAIMGNKVHPLIFFLDDVQWADASSLNLIEAILANPETENFLLICAYRDNEIPCLHPFAAFLKNLADIKRRISSIRVTALKKRHMGRFIAETFEISEEEGQSLSEVIHKKTNGNPFFTQQFLRNLLSEGLISHDPCFGWEWDVEKINLTQETDNVIDLMVARLQKLNYDALKTLQTAACMGSEFNLFTLAAVQDLPTKMVRSDLLMAEESKFIKESRGGYVFSHDRIQEALYFLIPEEQKYLTHRSIGRHFLDNSDAKAVDEKIQYIVGQLNAGIQLAETPGEKEELARLNCLAGKKAKSSSAFAEAGKFFSVALTLLSKENWTDLYDFTLTLHKQKAECDYLCGNFAEAERLLALALKNSKTAIDKAETSRIVAAMNLHMGNYERAIQAGVEGLRTLNFKLPKKANDFWILAEVFKIKSNLLFSEPKDLLNNKKMIDDKKKLIVSLLAEMCPAANYFDQKLWRLLLLKGAYLSIKHGTAPETAPSYAFYGMVSGFGFGNYDLAYELGQVSLNLAEKYGDLTQLAKVYFICGALINHWKKPLGQNIPYNLRGYRLGTKSGALVFAGYCAGLHGSHLLFSGGGLRQVEQLCGDYLNKISDANQEDMNLVIQGMKQFALALMGQTRNISSYSDDSIEEELLEEKSILLNSPFSLSLFGVYRLMLLYLSGKCEEGVEVGIELEGKKDFLSGLFHEAIRVFYYCLNMADHYSSVENKQKAKYLRAINANLKRLKAWSSSCPENFSHKLFLVEAEAARIQKRPLKAEKFYEKAIEAAKKHGFTQIEATARELAGKFYLSTGAKEKAKEQLQEARTCFSKWGASAKVELMDMEFGKILS